MVSPILIRKTENAVTVNANSKKLFQLIFGKKQKADSHKSDDDVPKIHVSSIVSQITFLYEKIRNAVDYDEEHLLRKNATKRILKRHILIEGIIKDGNSEKMSYGLLTELIQGGYLPNDKIPETKIKEIALLLEKYIRLREYYKASTPAAFDLSLDGKNDKERTSLIHWIISLAATEIEQNLNRNEVQQLMVSNMFDILSNNIKLPPELPYQNDLDIQIYLSIARNFLKLDEEMLSFLVFKYYNNWEEADESDLRQVAHDLPNIKLAVEAQLKHPLAKQLDKIIRRYSLYYWILGEIIEENPTRAFDNATSNTKAFTLAIKERCQKTYGKVKSKLWGSGMRSIVYIFLTKSVFVLILEVPMIKFFGEQMNTLALAINITFPAFLLFIMILFTRTPNDKNTEKIIDGIKELVYVENERHQPIYLRQLTRRNLITSMIFNLIYGFAFLLSVYLLIKLLHMVNFNWVSVTIFLFFLAFVSFFSFRIKRDVKKYVIIEVKENIFSFIFDFFYMPIVAVGKFLSDNISKINVFIFILDFIIETPFKVIVSIIEEWTRYLKERKEDLGN
jgi:hypothetical protein